MDKHEFEQFVTKHGKDILRFCRMNAGSTERGNELYQDKIFMQGVRPIGANNKIFLSEQAPTEYFIIHSCMSHSNSKIVAISTVKHLSRNYASFQQPSVQEWYSLSTSGQTQNIPNGYR